MFEDHNIGELCEKLMLSKLTLINACDQLNVLYIRPFPAYFDALQNESVSPKIYLESLYYNQQSIKMVSIKGSLHSVDNFIDYNGSLRKSAALCTSSCTQVIDNYDYLSKDVLLLCPLEWMICVFSFN